MSASQEDLLQHAEFSSPLCFVASSSSQDNVVVLTMAHRLVEPLFEPTGRPRSGLGPTFRHCPCRRAQKSDPARAVSVAIFPKFYSYFFEKIFFLSKHFFRHFVLNYSHIFLFLYFDYNFFFIDRQGGGFGVEEENSILI